MDASVRGVPIRLTKVTVIVLLLSGGAVAYSGYDYVQQSEAIDNAVAVNATVTEADVERIDVRRGTDYAADVEFTYQYEGTNYTGDRIYPSRFSPNYGTESEAEAAIEPYETNETVTAYVDPSEPSEGFLEPRRTTAPLVFSGLGAVIFLFSTLNAVGARTPGQNTGIRPASEVEPTRYETLFGLARDRVCYLSTRLMMGGIGVFALALLGIFGVILATEEQNVTVSLTDPFAAVPLAGAVGILAFLIGLLLYLLWSFTEYRRLRERLPDPRPPSPFRRPTRLATILTTNDGLDAYGTRVKKTGFALVVLAFCLGVILNVLFF
ncbi:DUF3592 domain-containing protein [Halovenus sp. WSH3]|uniref:DUF3592 domain-containing protein n=1 Tax=Halovenus carboxidivorans TaxID=2692199 RepID=A0A6B0TC91_9EURY|nr:DUF3592 domain-containing protein [Halovenus carboxidivorans]MXR52851.1 DUF3592 domain-containing protein [Halovenus carboxidivorans]